MEGYTLHMARKWRVRILATVLTGVLASLCCYSLGRYLTLVVLAQASVTPYVLKVEIYSLARDPRGILGITETWGRRSDGATVRVESMGPPEWGITGREVRWMDGRSMTLVDYFKTKTTWPAIPAERLARHNAASLHPPVNCIQANDQFLAGSDNVFGQPVVIVRKDLLTGNPPALGGRKLTEWRAPNLGCVALTYTVDDKRSDGTWWRTTEQRVVSLTLEEPDPQLFEDEPAYTEATRDDVSNRLLQERKNRGR